MLTPFPQCNFYRNSQKHSLKSMLCYHWLSLLGNSEIMYCEKPYCNCYYMFLLLQELGKMFNISDFYYYSPNGDITNSIQRQSLPTYDHKEPLWKRADERFFWNKSLMEDLINSNVSLFILGLWNMHVTYMLKFSQWPTMLTERGFVAKHFGLGWGSHSNNG